MRIGIISLFLGIILIAGCKSGPFEATENDKLTAEDEMVVTIYARHFMTSQSKTLKLSADELEIISQTRPNIRTYYTGYKEGRLSVGWELPTKQVFAIAEGEMMTTRKWRVSVVRKGEVIYSQKKSGDNKLPVLSPKDFDDLKNN